MAKPKSTEQEYVLLKCMEFFRDELSHGNPTERLQERYLELRRMCAQALGNPTLSDAYEITDRYKELHGD